MERAAAARRQIHSGESWICLVFHALASEMELGCFQNRYSAAELSNKQLHIKQDRDILWQGGESGRGDAFTQDLLLGEQIQDTSSASCTSADFDWDLSQI